jgi:hypothetical protein
MYFLLKAKGLNDNGYFLLINLTKVINLTIIQIEHLVKLVNGLVNKTTQSIHIGKCPSQ